jgi:hypothetical protein
LNAASLCEFHLPPAQNYRRSGKHAQYVAGSDLSLHGCFVQLPNPFPEGTPVTIEIYKDEDFVETPATVAYFMPKRGMGLTFTGPSRNSRPF